MEFNLSEEHRLLQRSVRDFARREVAPHAQEIERNGEFPLDLFRAVTKLGWLGAAIPTEYGGGGLDLLADFIIAEELATALPGFAMDCMVHSGVIGYKVIYRMGTDDQRKEYLPRFTRGEVIGAIVMTEPDAGSDVRGVKTTAAVDGDDYVLNGRKTLITNFGAPLPSVGMVLAGMSNGDGDRKYSAFLVEKDTPGISVSDPIEMSGMKSSYQNEVTFDDVHIPKGALLGKEGDGLKMALASIDVDRILCCALSTGIARGAYERAQAYSRQREAFGQPIGDFQAVQIMLAEMATKITASKLLGYYATSLEVAGQRCTSEAAMAKLFATTMAQYVTEHAMHIHGGWGYTVEVGVERFYRDNMAVVLGGGAAEILQLAIGKASAAGALGSLDISSNPN
ncbi:MAG: acyl-CoA dehydrogenase family protein [Chloroflexi bacterium]|nr:acyl-CoA dehydrogenase family protein [Chloroflexota bacterium]